jgi:two-component system sensor histidine kinase YesM
LDYEIEVDDNILDGTILKLTLQPIVENALYHGIKNKRYGGTIWVRAKRVSRNRALLEVQDNGIGCTPYKLGQIRERLDDDSDEISQEEEGFGLANVNKRIKLYYGSDYGLSINSQYQEGTQVTVTIPLHEATQPDQEE